MTAASLFELAVQSHRAGQFDRAAQLYRRVLEQTPGHSDALYLLSVLARQSGRLEEAAALLEQAVRVAPNDALCIASLGDVYRGLGRSSEAIAVLLQAIARKPDFAEAVFNLAVTFESLSDLDAAMVCYERAAELKPSLSQAAERLASVKSRREALAARGSPVTRGPEASLSAADGLAALAETLRLAGRPGDAAAWYRAALQLNSRLPHAQTALGAIHADAGRFDEAIEHFRRALEVDENFHVARSYLATALGDTGLLEESQALFREAVIRCPEDSGAHSALLFNMPFWPNVTPSEMLAEARAWMTGMPAFSRPRRQRMKTIVRPNGGSVSVTCRRTSEPTFSRCLRSRCCRTMITGNSRSFATRA